MTRPKPSWLWFLLAASVFLTLAIPRMIWNSPVGDEFWETTDGYYSWLGYPSPIVQHAPLATELQAIPLFFMGVEAGKPVDSNAYMRGFRFYFVENLSRWKRMLLFSRAVTAFVAILLGALLYASTRESPMTAGACLLFWVFEPNLGAHAVVASSDVPMTLFYFLSVYLYSRAISGSDDGLGTRCGLLSGIFAGAATACKYTALTLGPILLALEASRRLRGARGLGKPLWRDLSVWMLGFSIGLLPAFWLVTRGTPWDALLEVSRGIRAALGVMDLRHPNYYLGYASRTNHLGYYFMVLAVKMSPPLLILAALSGFKEFRKDFNGRAWIWAAPLGHFLMTVPMQNVGIRYLLPCLPFILLGSSVVWNRLWAGRRPYRLAAVGLALWMVLTSMVHWPDWIAYQSDWVRNENKLKYLADSNFDWGQDSARLAEVAKKRGWPTVHLAQFVGLDPGAYGMRWTYWTEKDLAAPQAGRVYAVNASFLQIAPVFDSDLNPIAMGWIRKIPPTEIVGETWWVWEIPGNESPDPSYKILSVPAYLWTCRMRPKTWCDPMKGGGGPNLTAVITHPEAGNKKLAPGEKFGSP